MTTASNDRPETPMSPAQASDSASPSNPSFSESRPTDDSETWNYESTVQSIEQIIDRIETGELELADIFDQFAIAVEQLHQCESFLNYHRQQVDLLIETLSDEAGSS